MQELDNVIQKIEDVKLMIRIRDCDHKTRWKMLKENDLGTLERIMQQYWCFDMVDLFSIENKLWRRFLELADISELFKTQ